MNLEKAKIHIIGGTGQMGSWLANFLISLGLSVTISGRKGDENNIKEADLIFISVPISAANLIIKNINAQIKKSASLIDMSSVMLNASSALNETKKPSANVHFLFGPNVATLQNQQIVFHTIKPSPLIKTLYQYFVESGAHIINMKPKEHDLQMAHIQSLTHFVNLALAKVSLDNKIDLAGSLSTPVFLTQLSLLNRVAAQKSDLLTEIQLSNPYSIKVLNQFLQYQKKLIELIEKNQKEKLQEEIEKIHSRLQPKKVRILTKSETNQNHPHFDYNTKIAFLGPAGTFSHQALTNLTTKAQTIPCINIHDIFQAVSIGRAEFGLVPAENSTEGIVRETFDYLIDFNLYANLSIELSVHQSLLSKEKHLEKIEQISSHPQALAQARHWLQKHLPNAKLIPASSTLFGIQDGLKEKTAIIGSSLAAKVYSLNILAKNIEERWENVTKFYLISKLQQNLGNSDKTLLFLTIFNRVGILRDILNIFAQFNINLAKIESRPSREKMWDYHFFIEVEKKINDQSLIDALNILKQYCPLIKILGSV